MNTKKVTEFDYINFLKSFKELVTREFYNPPGIRDVNKRIDEIIALLQRGEIDKEELKKVWQMWEEIRDNRPRQIGTYWEKYIDKLEQKHFPKSVKKTITKEVIK